MGEVKPSMQFFIVILAPVLQCFSGINDRGNSFRLDAACIGAPCMSDKLAIGS
jgi:hypothetical protein